MQAPRILALTALCLSACGHPQPAAAPVHEDDLQVLVAPGPSVELGELVVGTVPLATLYNATQAARGEQVAGRLTQHVSHDALHAGATAGARASLPALHAAPGASVQVEVERWGVAATLPGEAGALEVTVQARLLGHGARPVYTRPITCGVDLHTLAGDHVEGGPQHAVRLLEAIPSGAVERAAEQLAAECSTRALQELSAS